MCTYVLLIGHDEYSRGACGRTYLLEGLSHPYTNKSGVGARVVPLKSPDKVKLVNIFLCMLTGVMTGP